MSNFARWYNHNKDQKADKNGKGGLTKKALNIGIAALIAFGSFAALGANDASAKTYAQMRAEAKANGQTYRAARQRAKAGFYNNNNVNYYNNYNYNRSYNYNRVVPQDRNTVVTNPNYANSGYTYSKFYGYKKTNGSNKNLYGTQRPTVAQRPTGGAIERSSHMIGNTIGGDWGNAVKILGTVWETNREYDYENKITNNAHRRDNANTQYIQQSSNQQLRSQEMDLELKSIYVEDQRFNSNARKAAISQQLQNAGVRTAPQAQNSSYGSFTFG